jgi:hypothetical protein
LVIIFHFKISSTIAKKNNTTALRLFSRQNLRIPKLFKVDNHGLLGLCDELEPVLSSKPVSLAEIRSLWHIFTAKSADSKAPLKVDDRGLLGLCDV